MYGAGLAEHLVNGRPYFFLVDGLGSTAAIVDQSGNTVQSYTYDVYGQATPSSQSFGNEVQFAGQQTDPSGLQYLRARYYDPGTGRFLSRDTVGGHPYAYAGNSPTGSVDPSGNCQLRLIATSVAYIGGHTALESSDSYGSLTYYQAGPQYSGFGVLNPFGPGFGQLTPNNGPVKNVLSNGYYIVQPDDGSACGSTLDPLLAAVQGHLTDLNSVRSTAIHYSPLGTGGFGCPETNCGNSNNFTTALLGAAGETDAEIEAARVWLKSNYPVHDFIGFGMPAPIVTAPPGYLSAYGVAPQFGAPVAATVYGGRLSQEAVNDIVALANRNF